MPYVLMDDVGDEAVVPAGTHVYANPGAARKRALKRLGVNTAIYACENIHVYRWHGNLLTNKTIAFSKVSS